MFSKYENHKLCYIEDNVAYFTTQDLDKQWGDDWNDACYQHNAGTPYEPGISYYVDGRVEKNARDWNEDGTPKWGIIRLTFEGPFATPGEYHGELNTPWSVQDINNGATPWLLPWFTRRSLQTGLMAGVNMRQFIGFIKFHEGEVFVPLGWLEEALK